MPRRPNVRHAIPKDPIETISYQDDNGSNLFFNVFVEIGTQAELIKCDLCGLFFPLQGGTRRSPTNLRRHRGSKECEKEQRRKEIDQIMIGQKEAIDAVRFGSQVKGVREASSTSNTTLPANIQRDKTPDARNYAIRTSDLTPRASRANLRSDDSNDQPGILDLERLQLRADLPQSDLDSPTGVVHPSNEIMPPDDPDFDTELEDPEGTELEDDKQKCQGQPVEWIAGTVWETYAWQQHDSENIGWKPIGFSEDSTWIILRSKLCMRFLDPALSSENKSWTCNSCNALLNSEQLRRFMTRASQATATPGMPYIYRNYRQLKRALVSYEKKNNAMKLEIMNHRRKIYRLRKRVNDYKRIVMLLSNHNIPAVSRILATAFRKGASIGIIHTRLEQTISGTFRPRSGWSEKELAIAFLAKAFAGRPFLYALQKAESYPSFTTVQKKMPVPELIISLGNPGKDEMDQNIKSFLGEKGRKPPTNPKVGQVFMMDGVAIEEAIRYDFTRNSLLGLCREHSGPVKKNITSIDDLKSTAEALYPVDNSKPPTCHCGKDATVLGIAPVTDKENYHVVPLLLSPSCKSEKAADMLIWIKAVLEEYNRNPSGAQRHGPVVNLATDGESSFRKLRFLLCLTEDLDRSSAMGKILYSLPGLNCRTGANGIVGTCDPKHVIKRFATMLRSPAGIQVGDISLTSGDVLRALEQLMDSESAASLLNPADKQNVPKAVNLIQSLYDVTGKVLHDIIPSILKRMKGSAFVAMVLSYFLFPFIDVTMTLSQQISSLSTYSHLVTALYRMHRLGFLTSALLADSQAIVKSVLFDVVRTQVLDPTLAYFMLLHGTDRLENVFSHARTQDHARNFDILQLAQKLSIGTEIDAILQRYPDLDRGHIRRNLVNARGVDHINPKSWLGNVCVGDVNVRREYLSGRETAIKLMVDYFGKELGSIDFDMIFADLETDHLRPGGKSYIGFRASDEGEETEEEEDDDGGCVGSLLPLSTAEDEFEDARNIFDAEDDTANIDAEDLNPSSVKERSHYLTIQGNEYYLPSLVKEFLSANKERRQLSTVRGLRAQGVKIAQSLRGKSDGINSAGDTFESSEGRIKSGDLGAVLVRISDGIGLAVVEILNFRQGSSKTNLAAVDIDDLDETGSKAVTLAVQVLEILPQQPKDNEQESEIEWWWSRKYVKVQEGKDNTFQKRNFTVRIPGAIFHLLSPNVCYDGDDKAEDGTMNAPRPTWSLQNSELQETFNRAWSEMDPDSDRVVENVKQLPEFMGTDQINGLPYVLSDNSPKFYLAKDDLPAPLQVTKLPGTAKVDCLLCRKTLLLQNMRNHVGCHLLRARYHLEERGVDEVGSNACGWCGLDSLGCETHLFLPSPKTATTTSNCKYHYREMNYAKAADCSNRSPCTNVPIHCPLCPINPDGTMSTIWKYNLKYHLDTTHLSDTGALPILPVELIVTSHITREEELKIGIQPKETDYYRASEGIPDSDAIEAMVNEEWEGRKRGVSDVSASTSYSESRQPSPSKAQRRV